MVIGHDKREVRGGELEGHRVFIIGLDVDDLRHQPLAGRLGVFSPVHVDRMNDVRCLQ